MSLVYFEELFFTLAFIIYIIASIGFFVFLVSSKEKVGKFSVTASTIGFVIHTIAMILRIIESGRLPFSNQFEFANSFTWAIVLCYLVIHYIYKFTAVGGFVMPLAFLMMGYASMLPKTIKPLMPALQSRWLTIHVGTAIISYGSFAVATGLSLMYLINERHKVKDKKISHLPDAEVCDYLSYRVTAFGYLMLTLVIVTGAIWAKKAWSRYWGWDPKETWSLITWIIYSTYLHLRFNRGWKGKTAAWFSIIGFLCVIFTFIGVNVLLPGLHSYR
ncbi:MAG: c-type cytochrome biogenesis protein CcsB [Tissierellia bacterium]|nr:c-type cytochrome biogenesis protein CcsB [Tissierellia bacterium]